MAAETSLRELMRKAVDVRTTGVVIGIVTRTNPLEIRVANDAKLILSEGNVYVPKHLTDYKVEIEFDMETVEALGEHNHPFTGSTDSQLGSHSHGVTGSTDSQLGSHNHSYSGTTSDGQTYSGSTGGANQAHAHSVTGNTDGVDMSHAHSVSGTTDNTDLKHAHKITGVKECVIKNALREGDEVYILVYQEGSMYFVLDKVG